MNLLLGCKYYTKVRPYCNLDAALQHCFSRMAVGMEVHAAVIRGHIDVSTIWSIDRTFDFKLLVLADLIAHQHSIGHTGPKINLKV